MSQNSCCEQAVVQEPNVQTVVVTPRADGWETEDAYVLSVEMPGVDDAHLEVTLEKNVLAISGTTDGPQFNGLQPIAGNVARRQYERSFRLPEGIDAGQLDGSIRNGVLSLRVPKSQQSMRRKISVRQA